MNKRWVIISLIVISALITLGLFAWNLISASSERDVHTAISSWVGGIATVILGIIALVQNIVYKNTNEKAIILNDLEKKSRKIEDIHADVKRIININEFISISIELHNLECFKDSNTLEKLNTNIRHRYLYQCKESELLPIISIILKDKLFFKSQYKVCSLLYEAVKLMGEVSEFFNFKSDDEIRVEFTKVGEKLLEFHKKIGDALLDYNYEYNCFISTLKQANLSKIKKMIEKVEDLGRIIKQTFHEQMKMHGADDTPSQFVEALNRVNELIAKMNL